MKFRANTIFAITSSFFLSISIQGQANSTFNILKGSKYDRYFVVAIVSEDIYKEPELLFSQEDLAHNNTTLMIFNNSKADVEDVYRVLNSRINRHKSRLKKTNLHLLFEGAKNSLLKFENLNKEYFNTFHFVNNQDESIMDFTTTPKSKWSSKSYLKSIQKKYKWKFDVDRMNKVKKVIRKHDEGRFTIGYKLGVHSTTDQNLGIFDQYFTHGLNADYRLYKGLLLSSDLNFSLNRSDPQSSAQEQIFNQLDINAALDGSLPEQEVDLRLSVKGQLHLNTGIGLKYVFNRNQSLNPYIQSNVNFQWSKDLAGVLDTTLTIDINDAFSGGLDAGVNRDDLDTESVGLTELSASNINWGIGGGFHIKLNGYLRFDLGFDYSKSIKNLEEVSIYNNDNFSVSFGLNVRFKDKKEYFYKHFY